MDNSIGVEVIRGWFHYKSKDVQTRLERIEANLNTGDNDQLLDLIRLSAQLSLLYELEVVISRATQTQKESEA